MTQQVDGTVGGVSTGYFARPGTHVKTLVHAVSGNAPVCGCTVSAEMTYQWRAAGARLEYITCKKCRAHYAELELVEKRRLAVASQKAQKKTRPGLGVVPLNRVCGTVTPVEVKITAAHRYTITDDIVRKLRRQVTGDDVTPVLKVITASQEFAVVPWNVFELLCGGEMLSEGSRDEE